jgi:hypothetical protein
MGDFFNQRVRSVQITILYSHFRLSFRGLMAFSSTFIAVPLLFFPE